MCFSVIHMNTLFSHCFNESKKWLQWIYSFLFDSKYSLIQQYNTKDQHYKKVTNYLIKFLKKESVWHFFLYVYIFSYELKFNLINLNFDNNSVSLGYSEISKNLPTFLTLEVRPSGFKKQKRFMGHKVVYPFCLF